jgi:glucose/arabinose dehydrogenase
VKPIGIHSSIPVERPSVKPQLPEEELASLNVLDGFKVNLFASEADGVVKPSQMRWDERGRLWVACTVSYPQIKPGEKPNDYVLVCEDTDGDGRADKFTKFVESLFMPTGIELGDGGLYVAQGTEFFSGFSRVILAMIRAPKPSAMAQVASVDIESTRSNSS